jgi:hypothetical protein
MTASHAQAIGANGKGLKTYIRQIMADYYSSAEQESYSNKNMELGLEREEKAAPIYSYEHNVIVKKVGFVTSGDYVGCSPDRFADDNGLAEIKCPTDKVYLDLLLDEKIDTKYQWQIQMQMLICEKEWTDYVVFNPNFKQNLFVKRVYPDNKKVKALQEGFKAGEEMITEIENKMAAV